MTTRENVAFHFLLFAAKYRVNVKHNLLLTILVVSWTSFNVNSNDESRANNILSNYQISLEFS